MTRRLALSGLIAVLALAVLWTVQFAGPADSVADGPVTLAEIDARAARLKADMKAELASEGKLYEPGAFPNDWAFVQRAYPYDRINVEQLDEALEDATAMRLSASRGRNVQWVERGPTNIGARVADLVVHPTNPDIVYAAMGNGGVHKTVDGGVTWEPIFDDQPVLTIGAIALCPDDPDVIYVGTGEATASSFSWFGKGMYKSEDAGATWQYIGLEETRYIARVVVDPKNADRIWVAATGAIFDADSNRGIYRSLDAGASWEKVLALTDSTAAIDVAVNPDHPDTVYAAMWERMRRRNYRTSGGPTSGIWRSVDGGDSWEELIDGLPWGLGRIGLSVAESSPNIIYSIYADDPGYFYGIYKSTNHGDSWSVVNTGTVSNLFSSFGWYFGQIRVDPSDHTRVFALGVPMYRTEMGGGFWMEVADENHVDHHAMAFDPSNPSRIWEGNDGGIYVSDNSGDSWTKLYDQHTNEFYAIEIDYLHPERTYGGTQDNGTLRTVFGDPDGYERIFGGDGFYVLVDPTNSDVIYCEYQWGNMYKSENFALEWNWALDGVDDNDRRNWNTPIVMDPTDNETLYYGTYRVWKTTDATDTWTAVSPDLTNGDQGANFGTITTMAVAPSSPAIVYAGTDDSNVWRRQAFGGDWVNVSAGLPNRWVTRVAVDPTDPMIAYVTLSGLRWNEDISHVYRTDDGGATWDDISGNLPDGPCNVIVVDPEMPTTLYVGSDFGCYYTTNLGESWSVLGSGLPAVPVYDIKIHQPTRTLVAGTYGRSMLSIDLDAVAGIPDDDEIPSVVSELSNYPNPFNPVTTVSYALTEAAEVDLAVYDLAGRRVRTLERGRRDAGRHETVWDGATSGGRSAASGTYFLRMNAGGRVSVAKMNLVK
jgi:photosystem II stability/assembly factor-like uncharacterized protein